MSIEQAMKEAAKEAISEAIAHWGAPKLLLTVEEAADMLNFGKEFVRDEVVRGNLTAVGSGKTMRIERAELDKWIAARRR